MTDYKQPMKNRGLTPLEKETKKKPVSLFDLFEICFKSLVAGIIIGIVLTLIAVKSL